MVKPFPDERIRLTPQPLMANAFISFGWVHQLGQGGARRSHLTGAVECSEEACKPQLWLANVDHGVTLPLEIDRLERHPFSAQTFIPLKDHDYLITVCESSADGAPDLATLRTFQAHGHQAVTYRRNVWHAGLSVLGDGAQFLVSMSFTGRGDDDEFLPLQVPIKLPGKAFDTRNGNANGG